MKKILFLCLFGSTLLGGSLQKKTVNLNEKAHLKSLRLKKLAYIQGCLYMNAVPIVAVATAVLYKLLLDTYNDLIGE